MTVDAQVPPDESFAGGCDRLLFALAGPGSGADRA